MDVLDNKIIQELNINSRQSYKEIARKIGSKKDTVAYRVKKLESVAISKYVPVYSLGKLGVNAGKIYLSLKGLDKKSYSKLLDDFVAMDELVWVARCAGSWDLMVGVLFKSLPDFFKIKQTLLSKLGNNVESYDISFIEDGIVLDRPYLFEKNFTRKEFEYLSDRTSTVSVDKLDISLMYEIRNNARFEYSTLSYKLGVDSKTIFSRLRRLQKEGVIQGFTTFVNPSSMNLTLYKLCLYLSEPSIENINSLISFSQNNSNILHIIKTSASWDIEFELEDSSIDNVYSFISELKASFANVIKKIDFVILQEELKLDFFPNDIELLR